MVHEDNAEGTPAVRRNPQDPSLGGDGGKTSAREAKHKGEGLWRPAPMCSEEGMG